MYALPWLAVSAVAVMSDACQQSTVMATIWSCIEVQAEGYVFAGQTFESAGDLLASIREGSELKFVVARHCGTLAQLDSLFEVLNEDPRVRGYVLLHVRASLGECTPEDGFDAVDPKFRGFGVRVSDHSSVEKS